MHLLDLYINIFLYSRKMKKKYNIKKILTQRVQRVQFPIIIFTRISFFLSFFFAYPAIWGGLIVAAANRLFPLKYALFVNPRPIKIRFSVNIFMR